MQKEEFEIIGRYTKDRKGRPLIDDMLTLEGEDKYTKDFVNRFNNISAKFGRAFGRKKPTMEQISARLSGSAIVGRSLGHSLDWLRITTEQGQYVGIVEFEKIINKGNTGLLLFKEMAGRIGGVAAEELLGLSYPSSSLLNKVTAAVISRHLGTLASKNEWHFFHRALDYCGTALTANRDAFDRLSDRLSSQWYLDRQGAEGILKAVCCIPIDGYLYAD